ncbi:hypothetical protein [Flagellimonas olearia]|uniref:hypothetical protein n=1 Tax=Flagellimonas olearia TaxID=552546 RepID=UPI00147856A8|nr:hypothetical protein [Allomuricauda olearia]
MNKKSNLAPKVFLFLFLSLFLAIGCSKEESPVEKEPVGSTPDPDPDPEPEPEPEPVVYFTFLSDGTINTADKDHWIIIYDSNGNLLDHKPYESGEVLEFTALDSDVTDKITVTLFSYRDRTLAYMEGDEPVQCEGSHIDLTSYPEVSKGSNWVNSFYSSRLQADPAPNNLGQFTLTLENISGEYPIRNDLFYRSGNVKWGNLSTLRQYISGGSGVMSYNSGYTTMTSRRINWANTSYLMSILHADEGLKYTFFQNPDEGSDLTINYEDLQSFDSYVYLPTIPENERYFIQLLGFEDETSFKTYNGYYCLSVHDDNNGIQIPLGFLDRFTHYKTFLDIDYGNYEYHYQLLGPKPNITFFPEKPSIGFTQDDVINFDFATNADYIRRTDYFGGREPLGPNNCSITEWSVESNPENYPILSPLPDELYTKYPDLVPFDELKYESSTLYLQDKEYIEFLRDQFDPTYDHILKYGDITEYFTITRE